MGGGADQLLAQRLRPTPSLHRTPAGLRRRLPCCGRRHRHHPCTAAGRMVLLPLGHPAKITTHPLTYWRTLLQTTTAARSHRCPNSRPYPATSMSVSRRDRIDQSNTWFDWSTGRPTRSSSASIARAARKPVPPMTTASASSPRWREIDSTTAPGSMSPGVVGEVGRLRGDDLEPLAAEVGRTQVIE